MSDVIVLTSSVRLCLCVCLLPLSWPNGQTCRLEFWYVGQVEGYLGHVCRSRSQVKGEGHEVKNVSMGTCISMECLLGNRLSNITVRNTTTWGVFFYIFQNAKDQVVRLSGWLVVVSIIM